MLQREARDRHLDSLRHTDERTVTVVMPNGKTMESNRMSLDMAINDLIFDDEPVATFIAKHHGWKTKHQKAFAVIKAWVMVLTKKQILGLYSDIADYEGSNWTKVEAGGQIAVLLGEGGKTYRTEFLKSIEDKKYISNYWN